METFTVKRFKISWEQRSVVVFGVALILGQLCGAVID